jgi:hypothetical protein
MDNDTADLTGLIDRLRRDRRTDPYQGRREYSQTARDLADRCAALIDTGAAATVVPALRKAVDRITPALMYMDDSSGVVADDLQQLMGLYARACIASGAARRVRTSAAVATSPRPSSGHSRYPPVRVGSTELATAQSTCHRSCRPPAWHSCDRIRQEVSRR